MKILPFIFSLSTLVLLEWFIIQPTYLLIALGLIILLQLIIAWILKLSAGAGWWRFAILPVLASVVVSAYLSLLVNNWLIQILVIFLAVFNFVYWRLVYLYLTKSSRYISFSLENLSFYINFIIIFFLGSVAYGLRLFLSADPLWLGIMIAVLSGLVIYQLMWVSKKDRATWPYWLAIWLVLLEAFYIFMLLPLDYNLLGFFWASFYYVIVSLLNDQLSAKLNKTKIKLYLTLITASWLILLITARWL